MGYHFILLLYGDTGTKAILNLEREEGNEKWTTGLVIKSDLTYRHSFHHRRVTSRLIDRKPLDLI